MFIRLFSSHSFKKSNSSLLEYGRNTFRLPKPFGTTLFSNLFLRSSTHVLVNVYTPLLPHLYYSFPEHRQWNRDAHSLYLAMLTSTLYSINVVSQVCYGFPVQLFFNHYRIFGYFAHVVSAGVAVVSVYVFSLVALLQ